MDKHTYGVLRERVGLLLNKKILICVTGGIAVYKAVALVSKLSQAGAEVKVMMTASAMEFVTPLSFQVMSRNDVFYDTFDEKDSSVIAHIDLADWADLIIVAPATANVIGKLANGIADNMVTTTLLATTAEVWIAPAMNVDMYKNKSVIRNIEQLHEDGYRFIEPTEGFLACGYVGKGRLEEPEKIVELVKERFSQSHRSPSSRENNRRYCWTDPGTDRPSPLYFQFFERENGLFTRRSCGCIRSRNNISVGSG